MQYGDSQWKMGSTGLHDSYGFWHVCTCPSLFSLYTFLCFTCAYEGSSCLIRTVCKFSVYVNSYDEYHLSTSDISSENAVALIWERTSWFSSWFLSISWKVLALFVEGVSPASDLTLVCHFGTYNNFLSTILKNKFSTHLLTSENHKAAVMWRLPVDSLYKVGGMTLFQVYPHAFFCFLWLPFSPIFSIDIFLCCAPTNWMPGRR